MDAQSAARAMNSTALSAPKLLRIAGALLCIGISAAFAARSVNDPLWADELLTVHLLQAASLRKLWDGIALGIDGNPPLYLTAAWLLTRWLPASVSVVTVLKLLNLALVAAGLAALWHLGRRVASAAACWGGVLILVTLNENLLFAAFELRTYAFYFAAAALTALLQQRLMEHGRPRDVLGLALGFAALSLSHTFGIVYAGCIALAGWLSRPRDTAALRRMLSAFAPSVILMLAWSPVLREQLKVASPYGWITRPGWTDLAEVLFSSQLILVISLLAAPFVAATAVTLLRRQQLRPRTILVAEPWQPLRYVVLVAAGFTGFALCSWLVSLIAFPIVVTRFFTPQLVVSFMAGVVLSECMLAAATRRRAVVMSVGLVLAALMLRNVVDHAATPVHGRSVCADASGGFFERALVTGDLPVITDSPHVFLPRIAYASHRDAYRFALDWDVVLNYPDRSRGNAVDYHILQGLQTWLPMPQVMTTADILRDNRPFLVLETPARSWFVQLRATHRVEAEMLAQSASDAPGEVTCTLWKVTRAEAAR